MKVFNRSKQAKSVKPDKKPSKNTLTEQRGKEYFEVPDIENPLNVPLKTKKPYMAIDELYLNQ